MAKQKIMPQDNPVIDAQGQTNPEKMEMICRKITQVMDTEKLYLKPGLSVWELSRAVGCTAHDISRSINHYMGKRYLDLLKRMRMDEAKRLLREMAENGEKINMDEIGFKSGFRSRSAFFANFSEYEKMTPKKYMNLYVKNSQDKKSKTP